MRARIAVLFVLLSISVPADDRLPANVWTKVATDTAGARPGSAIRYDPGAHAFFLWGYMNDDPELPQEQPLMPIPEFDMVSFDPVAMGWQSHLPLRWAELWSKRLPLAYVPRTYAGITTGSERTILRGATNDQPAFPRPDLNIVFDQVTYAPPMHSLIYFTGGLTAAYDTGQRRWTDLAPRHSPPPVTGGSLAYDPAGNAIVLFGGGHVAERGRDGKPAGYAGTWVYDLKSKDWSEAPARIQPPPRMDTRLVTDTLNNVLVVFGGDGQSHYLADTWLFDLKTRTWRVSKAPGPEPRAGHFTVYDPVTGWILIGGGYNQHDLSDMWAYDARQDHWQRLIGQVPAGFYQTADIAPESRLIVLVTSTRKPGDRMSCNVLFPLRTTYAYRIGERSIAPAGDSTPQQPMVKRAEPPARPAEPFDFSALPQNRWISVNGTGRSAPARTWGSATFDTHREQILYWGGGHCGYGGSDVDLYDIGANTWRSSDAAPEYPERLWNHGVREAGVTFGGRPWMEHGRRIFAYDPVSRRMVLVRRLRLTAGYEPGIGRDAPLGDEAALDALVRSQSSVVRFVTWTFDPAISGWDFAGPAPKGVDTLLSTPEGVVGINVDWPTSLNDAGYQLPPALANLHRDTGVFLYRAGQRRWERLDVPGSPSPQHLYELTGLAYDTRRSQVILHGGGPDRNELWTFDMKSRRWRNMKPEVAGAPPPCSREAVYLPKQDVFLTLGDEAWSWRPQQNRWSREQILFDREPVRTGQNRAMVYDSKRDVVFLVLGESGNAGLASLFALRYASN